MEHNGSRTSATAGPNGPMMRISANHAEAYRNSRDRGLVEGRDFAVVPSLELIRVYTTNNCNAACAMCDIGMARGRGIDRLRAREAAEMPVGMLDRLLDMPGVKERSLKFSLGMVETLLHRDIGGIVRRIKERGHSVAVITNGILLERKAAELIDGGVDFVTVSIDGPPAVHDAIRGRPGIYRKAVDGVKRLHKLQPDLPVSVNCAVCNLNHGALSGLALSLENEGVRATLRFQHLYFVSEAMAQAHNNAVDDPALCQTQSTVTDDVRPECVDTDTLWDQMQAVSALTPKSLRTIRFRPVFRDKESLRQYYHDGGAGVAGHDRCFFPFNQVSVKTNGDVLFHSRCFDYILGNLSETDIDALFLGERADSFRALLRKHDYCFPACTRCCGIMGGWPQR